MKYSESEKFYRDILRIHRDIRRLTERRQELEFKSLTASPQYNRIGGTNRGHTDRTGHTAILITECDEKIAEKSAELKLKLDLMRKYIKQIKDISENESNNAIFEEQMILYERFINNASWNQILDCVYVSRRTMFLRYESASKKVDRLIRESKERLREELKNRR